MDPRLAALFAVAGFGSMNVCPSVDRGCAPYRAGTLASRLMPSRRRPPMHRSSESIAALAAALAKAQLELANPEKSLVGTIGPSRPGEEVRSFRYAPLSSGLDIVRKALGQQQIATVQTTAIDGSTGTLHPTLSGGPGCRAQSPPWRPPESAP